MTVAIAIVGGLAILLSLPTVINSWWVAADEKNSILYVLAGGATLGWFLAIALFVLALATQAVIATSIVGGAALLCGLAGVFSGWLIALEKNALVLALTATLGFFLTTALLALTLVK